jgi:hypothetical protein
MICIVPLMLALTGAFGLRAAGSQSATPPPPDSKVVTGVVKSASASSVTVDVRGRETVFAIGPATRFVGKGLSRDLLLREPQAEYARWFRTLVGNGNRVRVTYRASGRTLNAVEVRAIER